ncbi:MAG: amidohydrolase [Anaerovoracaceae bacterium]
MKKGTRKSTEKSTRQNSIRTLAEKNRDYIIERRRYYHSHPELSLTEFATTSSIKDDLEKIASSAGVNNLFITTFNDYPGLVADFDSGKPGRTILLRADIDALPIHECTGLSFSSQTPGVMHACGHDTHIAMLLGAIKILLSPRIRHRLRGKLKFIFQSGEETACGAKYYVDHGLLDDVDAVFGLHTWGTLDAPYICVDSGKRMASTDNFIIRIKGLKAHGAAPHLGHDAIVAASAAVMALQSFVSRENNPVNPLVLTVGKFHGGNMFNTICGETELDGTIRTFSKELQDRLKDEITNIVSNTVEAYGCSAEVEMKYMHPALVNDDEELNGIARRAALKLYGPEGIKSRECVMSGEDFSLYTEKVPGFFAFVGARNEKRGMTHSNHHEGFAPDESTLERGSAFTAQFALDYLLNKPEGDYIDAADR